MADFSELRLRIEGESDGVALTPATFPMARLLEYLSDLAQMMGHKEAVHLMKVDEGSAMPVMHVDVGEESRISSRLQQAQRGVSVKEANLAYKRFDDRLREDNAIANVFSVGRKAEIIVFPGRNLATIQEYASVRESGHLTGELKRVGGLDESVPVWLKRSDGEILICEADQRLAMSLGPHLYKTLRVHGVGTWKRSNEGVWKLDRFRIQTFDPQEGVPDSFTDTLKKLQAIPGNEWVTLADPLEEARALRYGGEVETA